MNTFFRVVLILFGVVLLAPGLCFLGFGGTFMLTIFAPAGAEGFTFGAVLLVIGVLILWGAIALIRRNMRPPSSP